MNVEAALLLACADGEASPEEAARVGAALRESSEARAEFARLLRHRLMLAELLAARAGPVVLLPAAKAPAPAPVPARRLRRYAFAAAAAAAAVLAAVGAYWALKRPAPAGYVTAQGAPLAYGQPLVVLGGEAVELKLADESVLRVGPESRVTVTAPRRVKLACGQTRVRCKSDGDNPFVVTAAGTTVRALGTEFLVMVDNEAGDGRGASRSPHEEEKKMLKKVVSVVVLSGAVMVVNGFGEIRLAAGEAGVSKGGERPARGRGAKDKDKGEKGAQGLGDEELKGLGKFVQEKLAEGLRGKELADAIHKRLEERKRARQGGKGKGKGKGEGKGKKHQHKHGEGEGDGEGKGKQHQHKHKEGAGDGEGEGKGKKHQHKHGEGDGEGEGKGKKHRHKHKEGEGEGKGKGEGKGGGGEGKGHGKGGGDKEPGAGGEGEGKGKGHGGGGGGGGRGGRGGGGRGGGGRGGR